MPWYNKTSTPEQVAKELKINLEDKDDNARLLIMGTETPEGYTMRMTLKHPEAIAGILYNHALKTGEMNDALAMAEALTKIGLTAKKLIEEAILKRKLQN